MGVPGINILISTQRASFNRGNNSTGAASTYLDNIPGHILPTSGRLHMLPASCLKAEYEVRIESGTDVRMGDTVYSLTLVDGKTPWPGLSLSSTPSANEVWRVADAVERAPMTLPYRSVYLERTVGGGPVY